MGFGIARERAEVRTYHKPVIIPLVLQVPQRESGGGAQPGRPQQATGQPTSTTAAAAAKSSRVRHRKAVLASGALTNTVQTALKALQESSERDVLRGLTTRVEQLLEGSRKADWAPAEPLPSAQSPWVNALLSYLQVGGARWLLRLLDCCLVELLPSLFALGLFWLHTAYLLRPSSWALAVYVGYIVISCKALFVCPCRRSLTPASSSCRAAVL
jgi:hypothetical protein